MDMGVLVQMLAIGGGLACGADMSSVVRTDVTVYFRPKCGMPYGGAPINSTDYPIKEVTDVRN